MEMTIYEFIAGMVGTFFVLIPALGLLFYALFKEMKEAKNLREEQRNFQNRLVSAINNISEKICCNCFNSQTSSIFCDSKDCDEKQK